jgi:hypothetical protein
MKTSCTTNSSAIFLEMTLNALVFSNELLVCSNLGVKQSKKGSNFLEIPSELSLRFLFESLRFLVWPAECETFLRPKGVLSIGDSISILDGLFPSLLGKNLLWETEEL